MAVISLLCPITPYFWDWVQRLCMIDFLLMIRLTVFPSYNMGNKRQKYASNGYLPNWYFKHWRHPQISQTEHPIQSLTWALKTLINRLGEKSHAFSKKLSYILTTIVMLFSMVFYLSSIHTFLEIWFSVSSANQTDATLEELHSKPSWSLAAGIVLLVLHTLASTSFLTWLQNIGHVTCRL